LTLTSGGTAVTTVTAGSVVTLTATVKSGATAVTPGQVNFCNVAGVLCTDVHLLGTAQLNSTGTAVLKFRPGVGSYSYKAVFAGKKTLGTSSSPVAKLTVTHSGLNGTATTLAQSGDIGNYTLTATVGGRGLTAPAGTIAFLDSSFGNAPLGSAALTGSPMGLNWRTSIQSPVAKDYSNGTAIGDFNGDGIPDMAVVTFSYSNADQVGSVAVLLGNGDGSFTQLTSTPLSDNPVSIAVGDFNGDGVQDLAISNLGQWNNGNAGYVTILLGKGDGTFKVQATRPATGYTSDALAVGDFNGDGVPDLAVVNEGSNANSYKSSVTILLGKGDGTFTATSPSPSVGSSPTAIVVGDFNGDSKADLAVADQGGLTILLGKGDGTFTTGAAPSAPVFSNYILAADFNGDGKTDLVCGGASSIPLIILLGKGDGTFTLAPSQPQGVVPNFVSIGDFNGDGIPDLAAAGYGAQGTGVTILLGKGDGTFASAGFTTSYYPSSIATGDFDGDGDADVVAVNGDNSSVTTLLTRTASAYATVSHISVAGPGPHQVKASYSGDSDYNSSLSMPTPLYAPTPKPAFSVAQGTYARVQTVSITDATPGAKIFYSTNGYPPYPDSNPYLGPITVSSSQTIMAIAVGPGYGQSLVASATYTIQLTPAATPVISPGSGVYPSARSVTVSAASPGSTIYYTTNGTIPNTGSARYSGAIPVNTPMTLMAIAAAPGYTSSAVASAQYYFSAISMPLLYTIAGNGTPGYTGDNVPAAIADLNQPSSAVFDRAGNFYIADSANNRIRKIDATTGNVTTYAGNGTPGYSGDKGAATKAQLNFPNRIAIDSADNLYIPDINNSAVRKVTAATGVITTIAGTGIYGQSGCGLTGLATSALLRSPGGVAVDAAGNVFIADQGCARILEIIKSTGNIVSVAGGGSNLSDNIQATTAKLLSPHSVAVDGSGNLYFAESSSHKIRKVTHATGIISTVAGNGYGQGSQLGGYTGDGGPAIAAELNWPTDAKVDSAGNIYIVDMQNNVVRKVTAATQKISTIAGNGFGAATANSSLTCGYSGDGGLLTSAGLCAPSGVTVDAAGNLYISDRANNVLRKVTVSTPPPASSTATPAFTTSAGVYPNPQSVAITDATRGASIHFTMDGTVPTAASPAYNGPINVGGTVTIKTIAIAPGYQQSAPVTATYTITSPAALITTVVGSGVAGTINPAYGVSGNSAIGGAPLNANLGFISDLAIDGAGNIYLVDSTNNVVWMASVRTGLLSIVAGSAQPGYFGDGGPATSALLNYPVSVTLDNAGNLYIADENNNVIRKVSAQTGIITTFAGNSQCGDTGDGSLATSATLCIPTNVRFDKDGNLYIADTGNYLIRKVDTKSGIISTFAGNETSYSGDGKAATMAGVENPYALAFDSIGNLYIGGGDGRVRKVTKSTGIITTVFGNGDIGYSGDGGLAANAEVNLFGLAFDSANNLYIANGPAAVRQVSPTGAITTIAGNGFCGFSGDGGSATIAQLCAPNAIALDAAGNLYIADSSNYRVRKVVPLKPAATPAFSLQSGTYTAVKTVTISDNAPNAKIYYTTNGTAPSTASSLYSGAIPVNQTTTINAIAAAAGYLNSAAATATYTIQQPQTISFTAPATPVTYGVAPIALVASASSALPIKFTVLSGLAAISATTLTITGAGTVVVTASQAGNNSYAAATTVSRTITVNKAAPALALAASAATAASGKSVTFTATITGSKTLPTGTVTFLDGTTQLGTGTLNSVGVATYATTKLSVGTHNITTSYPGDVNYSAKTSASVKVTISAH
jgi:sugar lactone lactonase YvrE